jgi:phytoene synthase
MAVSSRLSACAALVRRYDHDRFLTALFAPAERREALFALYAFNLEVAKTRETVSESLLGQIRLQWWREAIEEIYAGRARRHEVVEPLARAVAAYDLPRAPFDRLIDAREFDLTDAPPSSLEALETYADATGGGVVALALHALGSAEPAALAAAREVGIAWALTGLARAVLFHARARRQYLPEATLAAAGASTDDLFELRPTAPLAEAVRGVADAARRHLSAARATQPGLPAQALPALLPATLAGLYLDRLSRIGHDVLRRPVEIAAPRRQLSLMIAAWRGRF